MFKKEKSKTLKFLNLLYIIGMVSALIALVFQIVSIIIPENYTSSSPYRYNTDCYGTLLTDCIGASESQSVDFRPIGCIILSMLCASAVVFVCNKYIKYFNVEKSSGLKLLTALAAISIISVASSLFSGIIYGALSDTYFGSSLIVMVFFCIFSAVAPLLANRMHILDSRYNKWLDYANAIFLAGLVGTSTALVNSFVYLPMNNCTYYCDQNATTRTIVYQILAIVILIAVIATVRHFSRRDMTDKTPIDQQGNNIDAIPPTASLQTAPEPIPEPASEPTLNPVLTPEQPLIPEPTFEQASEEQTIEPSSETTPSDPSHMDTLSSPE